MLLNPSSLSHNGGHVQVLTVANRTQLEQVAPLPSSELLEFPLPLLDSPTAASLGNPFPEQPIPHRLLHANAAI